MTNQEWLATLTKEECWETLDWMLHDYGKRYIDTRLAVMEWLGEPHDDSQ